MIDLKNRSSAASPRKSADLRQSLAPAAIPKAIARNRNSPPERSSPMGFAVPWSSPSHWAPLRHRRTPTRHAGYAISVRIPMRRHAQQSGPPAPPDRHALATIGSAPLTSHRPDVQRAEARPKFCGHMRSRLEQRCDGIPQAGGNDDGNAHHPSTCLADRCRRLAASACPHRSCGRQTGAGVLGPLGAGRQRRHDAADHRLGTEEPGGGHHRLHERRQQAGDHRRRRRAGEDRPRRDGDGGVGGAQPRPWP